MNLWIWWIVRVYLSSSLGFELGETFLARPMKILIDIVHPANVLFFYHPIRRLLQRGDEVIILSREKDIACELLDSFGLSHTPVSRAGNGLLGLGAELIWRDFRVLREARRFRPDVMIGFGGRRRQSKRAPSTVHPKPAASSKSS